ncbi:MAG: hypothetical protein AAF432_07840 [Planctomycetota bacterium]
MYIRTMASLTVGVAAWCGATTPLTAADVLQTSPGDAIVIQSAGIEALLADPKDAGLVRALRLLDDRVLDLPRELNDDDIPAPAVKLALDMLMSPMTFRGGIIEGVDFGEEPPFYLQLDIENNTMAGADSMAGKFRRMLEAVVPDDAHGQREDGLYTLDADGVPVMHGSTSIGDSPVFTTALQRFDPKPASIGRTELPADVDTAVGMRLDLGAIAPLIHQVLEGASDEEREIMHMSLKDTGLLSENPPVVTVAIGHGTDRAYSHVRMANYAGIVARTGVSKANTLNADDFQPIPRSATHASVKTQDLLAYVENTLESMRPFLEEASGMDWDEQHPFDAIAEQSGFHIRDDLLAHLGTTMGTYASDETGGGLLGMVCFMEIENQEGIQETFDQITGMANMVGTMGANGYVRITSRTIAGSTFSVLTFPGLPVPLELSFGQAGGYFFMATSPQALLAAFDQVHNGTDTLLSHPRFREMGGASIDNAVAVSFVDTPRLISNGYGLVNLGMAALSNMTRSPNDPNREPGFIMPSYEVLAEGAMATVTLTRIEGDDIVVTAQGDRSALVNLCATAGVLTGSSGLAAIAAVGLGAGIMLPAVEKARTQARATQSMSMLRNVAVASATYAAEWNDKIPANVNELHPYLGFSFNEMSSPYGPAWDGGPDYWFDASGGTYSAIKFPSRQIMSYDRAMYLLGDDIAVGFADGHVELLSTFEFEQKLHEECNSRAKTSTFVDGN